MMILIENGYVQDGLKALVYAIPVIYLLIKRKRLDLKYFWVMFAGLSLLFFGNLIDFLDELETLRNLPINEFFFLLQDFFEDIIGFTLGFAVFIAGLFMEYKEKMRG